MIRLQFTVDVEGSEADIIRVANQALDDGVLNNALGEHEVEGVGELRIVSISLEKRVIAQAPEPKAPDSDWPEDCHVLSGDPVLTRLGREKLAAERAASWDPPPKYEPGDLVIVEREVLEVVQPEEPAIRGYILQEPKRIMHAPENILKLVVKGNGRISPRRF